ncbi:unnamed protein product [Protopolystoma xenopodis]|uniref:Suppressor of fused-like domain-containing protein n=1 Tax=Protopolystoma xenopodis TaxID=117903 RepID=A0A448XDG2_9PLAT|nr:unnamed protein product [Protopolystoma xenopodis]
MGGPDPLDYVNMYANPGTLDGTSPIHWHYVTNGFSDLYGDSRIHSLKMRMEITRDLLLSETEAEEEELYFNAQF